MTASAIYSGIVAHARRRPHRHRLRYAIFMLLLDLDEIDALAARLWLFSRDRLNLVSFHNRDHGDGSEVPLRMQITNLLRLHGLDWDGGPIRMLAMPRVLGHAFNPLAVYYCHRQDGGLAAMLYEVNNTFGQRHSYLLPVDDAARHAECIRQSCDKSFYVSPFMDMQMRYRFTVERPGARLALAIDGSDKDGLLIATSFCATRRTLTDRHLLAAFLRVPLLGLKVLGGIHWEALKLWRKGVALHPRPAPPGVPVTFPPRATSAPIVHRPEGQRPAA